MTTVPLTSRVSDNLLAASDGSFSAVLALLEELSLFNLMWSKGADALEKLSNRIDHGKWASSDHFQEKLAAKAKQVAALPRGERLLRTIGELQKLVELKPRDLHTRFDLSEVAEDLCVAAVKILREDKKAKFSGNDVGAMITFQMAKVFGDLNIPLEELSGDQQEKLVAHVRTVVQSLPADQQRFIMGKVGASDLSEAAIRQALAGGAMWTAFATAVNVFGFAFYTTAAQLLAFLSLNLLPFGAYIGLSSLIAVVASAWILPISAAIWIWYYISKNKGLRKSMAPLIITGLCLSGMEETELHREEAVEEALSLWGAARSVRDQKRSATASAKAIRDQAEACSANTGTELSHARDRKRGATTERSGLEERLKTVVTTSVDNIASGQWGGALVGIASRVQQIENDIRKLGDKPANRSGIWQLIVGPIEDGLVRIALNFQLASAKDDLVQQVKSAWPHEGTAYPESAASLLRRMEEKTSQILSAEADITRLSTNEREDLRRLDQASVDLNRAEAAQAESEKRYHGLGTV
jgi:hypothetical protein